MNKVLFTSYLCDKEDVLLQEILNEWRTLNSDYEVLYFSDSDVNEFFKDTPQYKTYSKMKNGVAIADFFRICYINKFGGYWFDLDVQPISLNLPESGDVHLFDAGFDDPEFSVELAIQFSEVRPESLAGSSTDRSSAPGSRNQ